MTRDFDIHDSCIYHALVPDFSTRIRLLDILHTTIQSASPATSAIYEALPS
jgi:hypothetical protein